MSRPTNNKWSDCPPRMSDGRQYTDYHPRCFTNFFALPHPMNSYDYRMFLTANAEKLMDHNREAAVKWNECGPCVKPSTQPPEQTIQVCDGRKCAFTMTAPHGIGIGRQHDTEEGSGRFQPNDSVKSMGAPLV
jgi:hypothetical protein